MPALAHPGVIEEPTVSLGSFFRKQRTRLGLSQREVAEASEIQLPTYKAYEQDRGTPPLDKARRLSDVLQFDPRDLFEEMDRDEENPIPKAKARRGRPSRIVLARRQEEVEAEDEAGDLAEDDLAGDLAGDPRRHVVALAQLRGIVESRGIKSRHLPPAIDAAEKTLAGLDADEIEDMVKALGMNFIPCPKINDLEKLSVDEMDAHCEGMVPRLIVAALYGDVFEKMDRKALEGIVGTFTEHKSGGFFVFEDEVISGMGWLENESAYLKRLRRELAPLMIEAIKRRKPVVIDENTGDDEEDRETRIQRELYGKPLN